MSKVAFTLAKGGPVSIFITGYSNITVTKETTSAGPYTRIVDGIDDEGGVVVVEDYDTVCSQIEAAQVPAG